MLTFRALWLFTIGYAYTYAYNLAQHANEGLDWFVDTMKYTNPPPPPHQKTYPTGISISL